MAMRYLTELFSLMRNSHSYRSSSFSQSDGVKDRLLKRTRAGSDEDIELEDECFLPPSWYDIVEDTKYTISKVTVKMTELEELHKRLLRPNFADKVDDEMQMEHLAQEISKLIGTAHKNILSVKSHQLTTRSHLEQKLIGNVISGLIVSLQEKTLHFKMEQNDYLQQINSMQEYTNEFFDSLKASEESRGETSVESFDNFLKTPSTNQEMFNASQLDDLENDGRLDDYFQMRSRHKLSQKQLLQFTSDNTTMMEVREKEVMNVVRSIADLNQIYKELSQLVQNQGTILDRIDYNVEATQTRVYEGFKQLQKAEQYQRTSRKMYCILLLSVTTLFMILLLIATKF